METLPSRSTPIQSLYHFSKLVCLRMFNFVSDIKQRVKVQKNCRKLMNIIQALIGWVCLLPNNALNPHSLENKGLVG